MNTRRADNKHLINTKHAYPIYTKLPRLHHIAQDSGALLRGRPELCLRHGEEVLVGVFKSRYFWGGNGKKDAE